MALGLIALCQHGQAIPFMADDYVHLLAKHDGNAHLWAHFRPWLARVPVWAIGTWALFSLPWLEGNPQAAALGAFFLHGLGVALTGAALLRRMPTMRPVPWGVQLMAGMAATLYPNTYEIIFWPTCMAYSLGAALFGLGAWARPQWLQGTTFILASLTYETFILPVLVWLLLPWILAQGLGRRALLWRALRQWGAVLAIVLALRAAFASRVGAFSHGTNFSVMHGLQHMGQAFVSLLRFRHYHMHTALGATILFVAFLVTGLVLLPPTLRRRGLLLFAGVYAATALFWVLNYDAMRSLYGAQQKLRAVQRAHG
ncbi:MAG: hypothetical protein EOO40_02985, partial [Deltaproteobacteria bacterium]